MPSLGRSLSDAPGAGASDLPSRLIGVLLLAASLGSLPLGCGGKRANAERVPPPTSAPAVAAKESAEPSAPAPTCGLAGMPECPLQHWMDHHLSGPQSRGEYAALEESFHQLAAAAPSAFTGWRAWAEGGAAAATLRDHDAISKACTGCHDGYRERYRKTMRARPMAGSEAP